MENTSAKLSVSPQGQTKGITYTLVPPVTMPVVEWVVTADKINTPILSAGTYYWKAKSTYESSESSYSPLDSFVVQAPFLSIKRPSEKAIWYHDSSYVISWNTNIDVPVKIDLVKNDNVVATVKSNVPASQQGFLWKVPVSVPNDTGYVLRITPMDGTLANITQETPFSIEIRAIPSSVSEIENLADILIGPNPVANTLYIGGHIPLRRVYIFSVEGELQVEHDIRGTGDSFDVSLLAPGTYVVRCETSNGPVQRTIVIQR